MRSSFDDGLDLTSLSNAVVVSEQGSFRLAARFLGVSTSLISRRVRALEDSLGVSLFHRTRQGVQPTTAGIRVLKRARSILSDIGSLRRTALQNGTGAEGHLRLGIFASIASGFSRHLLASFGRDHPGLELEVVEGLRAENIAAVRALALDFTFVSGMPMSPGCELEELWRERVMVALPENHHLARAKLILWQQLEHERFIVSRVDPGPEIQDYIVRGLAELGKHPNVDQLSVQRETLLGLVGLGQGLSLVGEAEAGVVYPGVTFRPLDHEDIPFCLVWSTSNDNPAFRRFLSSARLRSAERRATRPKP